MCGPKRRLLVEGFAVAAFATVGVSLRLFIERWTRGRDFGITTVSDPQSSFCVKSASASGYFFQNVLGCTLVAFVTTHKKALNPAVAAGLSSGLCGSLTTFGTWMQEVTSTALLGSVFNAFVSVICMFSVSLAFHELGLRLAACCDTPERMRRELRKGVDQEAMEETTESTWEDDSDSSKESDVAPVHFSNDDVLLLMDCLVIGASVAVVAAMFVYTGVSKIEHVNWYHVGAAPLGAVIRWALSKFNPRTAPFPAFTLLANVLGCTLESISSVKAGMMSKAVAHDVWAAVGTGIGGSLSTVSTFISEVRSETMVWTTNLGYVLLTFFLGLIILVPVNFWYTCGV